MKTAKHMLDGVPTAPNEQSAIPHRYSEPFESRLVYFDLLRDGLSEQILTASRRYLAEHAARRLGGYVDDVAFHGIIQTRHEKLFGF